VNAPDPAPTHPERGVFDRLWLSDVNVVVTGPWRFHSFGAGAMFPGFWGPEGEWVPLHAVRVAYR
jgi:hypothetical protein